MCMYIYTHQISQNLYVYDGYLCLKNLKWMIKHAKSCFLENNPHFNYNQVVTKPTFHSIKRIESWNFPHNSPKIWKFITTLRSFPSLNSLGSLPCTTHTTHTFNNNLKKIKENLGGFTPLLGKLGLSLDWCGLDIEL